MTRLPRLAFTLGAAVCAGLALPGCPAGAGSSGDRGDTGATPATGGGVLIYARGNDSEKLDPVDVSDGESVKVINNLYENLVTQAPTTPAIVPALATAWTVADDGLRVTFTLRAGVKFHDGTDCDAAAVKFSLDRLIHKDDPHRYGATVPYEGEYRMIQSVSVTDAATVVIHLHAPSATLVPNLAMFPAGIVSPTAVRKHQDRFAQNPVGTGPFQFVQWTPNEKLVIARNDGYWGDRAKVDRVIFVPVPEQAARLQKLERGEAHMMDNIDFAYVAQIQAHPDMRWESVDGMNLSYLAMNNERAPFDNPTVRRAVAHAIDKAQLQKLAYFGFGKTGVNPMPPTIPGYHTGLTDHAHDIATAKALLAEAGFPDGFDTDLWAMPNPRPYMPKPKDCGQIVKEQLAQVGIRCTIVSPPWSEYLQKTRNGEHPLCLLGWTTDNGDPDNFLNVLLSMHNATPPAQNVSFYKNPACQKLLDEAATLSDHDARMALYRQAQELIHADVPMVPLAYMPLGMAMRNEVQGYPLNPIGTVRLHTVTLSAKH